MPQTSDAEWTDRTTPVREDMAFQRKAWRVQRWGWAVLALALALAALGLFSEGPLSRARASVEGLEISYQRVLRNDAAASITMRLSGPFTGNEVVIDPVLAAGLGIETILPAPVLAHAHDDGLHLTFAAPPNGARAVEFAIRARTPGVLRGSIGLARGPRADITIVVLP